MKGNLTIKDNFFRTNKLQSLKLNTKLKRKRKTDQKSNAKELHQIFYSIKRYSKDR